MLEVGNINKGLSTSHRLNTLQDCCYLDQLSVKLLFVTYLQIMVMLKLSASLRNVILSVTHLLSTELFRTISNKEINYETTIYKKYTYFTLK